MNNSEEARFKNKTPKEKASKKVRVHYLVVVKGYTYREAGKLVDISERTVSKWAKQYNWNEKAVEKEFKKLGGLETVMDGFITYVEKHSPNISHNVNKLWQQYLQTLDTGTSIL